MLEAPPSPPVRPQAPPRMGAWPPHSCGGEGGGGAIPEALPAAPTGEGCPRRRDSGRGREGSRGALACRRGSGNVPGALWDAGSLSRRDLGQEPPAAPPEAPAEAASPFLRQGGRRARAGRRR